MSPRETLKTVLAWIKQFDDERNRVEKQFISLICAATHLQPNHIHCIIDFTGISAEVLFQFITMQHRLPTDIEIRFIKTLGFEFYSFIWVLGVDMPEVGRYGEYKHDEIIIARFYDI